ncbi:ATP-binding protein [Halomonas sp. CH40]
MRVYRRFYQSLTFTLTILVASTSWAMPDFETFFTQHSTPMWMIDVETGIIERANPAARAFYGFEQLEGRHIDQINMLSPAQINAEIQLAAEAQRNHLYFRHRLADGSVKVMGVYTDPFEVEGREVLISSLYDTSDFEDSAERHYIQRMEEQVDLQTAELQASRQRTFWIAAVGTSLQLGVIGILAIILLRLRAAQRENNRLIKELSFRNRELERLSQVMAHHFQEPSRRLVSFAQQLSQQLSGQQSQQQSQQRTQQQSQQRSETVTLEAESTRTAVNFIDNQARQLRALVSDIQRYLSLEITLKPETIDVAGLIEEVCTEPALAPLKNSGALDIVTPLPAVKADARQLRMIFHVLLHNAWQYRHPDKPLQVRISAQIIGNHARLRIEDNGSGISPEYRTQVLEMFTRLVPHNERYPGTGMGLALVVKALRNLDSRIVMEDGIDGGIAVLFDLPLAR